MLERNKLAQELSEASRVNKELKEENENLINLQSVCQNQMKSLSDVQKRRKDEKISFDLFKSLPKEEVQYQKDGELGTYKVYMVADEEREKKQKKEKKEEDMKMKEFKRKRNLDQNESMERRKMAVSLSEETLWFILTSKTSEYLHEDV